MRRLIKKIPIAIPKPKVRLSPTQALYAVTSKSGLGVYASNDRLYKGAVFGRDSLEVADDLMYIKPKLVEKIILTLARLQGVEDNVLRDEEPGKIIHEYRTPTVDGRPLNQVSREIYERLGSLWGGTEEYLAYYGSADATPLFIKVTAAYCQAYGLEILTRNIKLRNGENVSLLDVMDRAIDWLINHIDNSKSGFVEYHRRNPKGLENQVWKDSAEFYVHEDGQLANHNQPISSIEVQGLAYDAFVLAAELLPSRRATFLKYAKDLQQKTLETLWDEDRKYFSLGTDYDEAGKLRVIRTVTANPAELLDNLIFDNLAAPDKKRYVGGLVREIMGLDFLTDAGIRSRALSENKVVDFWDYHGSFVTWPKETYDIAKGLRRQKFPALARELENRLLNVVRATKTYPEFIYVDARGRVLGIPTQTKTHGELVFVDSTDRPEKIQAWTVSAVLAIYSQRRFHSVHHTHQFKWHRELEAEVLRHIPLVPRLKSTKELSARYPTYPYQLRENNE